MSLRQQHARVFEDTTRQAIYRSRIRASSGAGRFTAGLVLPALRLGTKKESGFFRSRSQERQVDLSVEAQKLYFAVSAHVRGSPGTPVTDPSDRVMSLTLRK